MRHALIHLALGLGISANVLQQPQAAEQSIKGDSVSDSQSSWAPAVRTCCHECPKEKHSPCHKSCDKSCKKEPHWEEHGHHGLNPKVALCLTWCKENDWECKKECHGIVPMPPAVPDHPEHKHPEHDHSKPPKKCDSCKKCKDDDDSCFKKCADKCKKPEPKPCHKCKPWNFGCKNDCKHKHQPHHHKEPVSCKKCADWDKECFETCYLPEKVEEVEWKKPESKPCHKCHHDKPECHKSCRPSPCHKCKPEHKECKKTCKPSPCHKCKPEHKECKQTCKKPERFGPPHADFKPWPKPEGDAWPHPFPKCCDSCKKEEHKCHESCISRPALERFVSDYQAAVPEDAASKMTNDEMFEKIADHLDSAVESADASETESSENTEKESPESESAEQADESTHQPVRRAEAAKQCRCADGDKKCIETCVTIEIEKEIVICTDCHGKKDCGKAKQCKPVKPKPCNECKKCDKEKEKESCKKTCYPKPGPPVPCGECSPRDKGCKQFCIPPKPFFHKPRPCWDCKKDDVECKKHCFIPEDHHHEPFCCKKCHKDNESCNKKCDACKPHHPKPASCWDCKKDESKCHKNCVIPDEAKPFCCDKCHKDNKSCHKKCKPAPKPVPCLDCHKGDFECLKHCFWPKKPEHEMSSEEKCVKHCDKDDWECKKACYVHEKPHHPHHHHDEKPKCYDDCKKHDDKCHKSCWKKPDVVKVVSCDECAYKDFKCLEHCKLKPKHDKPHHEEPQHPKPKPAPLHPHAPGAGWGGQQSNVKEPGQIFGACPANIKGDHQFPKSIIPISSAEPNKAYGNTNAFIDDKVSSIFNFELPASYAGKTCSLFFYFPEGKTDSCTFSGKGYASFDVVGKAQDSTTCSTKPQVYSHVNNIPMKAGTTYWVSDHPCTPGDVSFEISGKDGFALTFPQHQPIGLFVRAC